MKMNLLTTYEYTLGLGSIVVNDDGSCSVLKPNGNKLPFFIKTKDVDNLLVLPTNNQLKKRSAEQSMIYHPFRENLTRGESEVLKGVRNAIKMNSAQIVSTLFISIIELCLDTASHSKLNPTQVKIVSSLKDVDGKTRTAFNKIIKKMISTKFKSSFTNLYLKKNGKLQDVNYYRLGVWSFPFYEDLCKAKGSIYEIDVRDKDIAMLKKIHEHIFPNIAKPELYSAGASQQTAPYAQALFLTAGKLFADTNKMAEILFGKNTYLTKAEAKEFYEDTHRDIAWLHEIEDLSHLEKEIMLIPMQDGNEGSAIEEVNNKAPAVTIGETTTEKSRWGNVVEQAPQPVQQIQPNQPYQQPQLQTSVQPPVQQTAQRTGGGISFNDLMRSTGAQQQQQYQQQLQQQQMYQNQMQQPMIAGYGSPTQMPQGYNPYYQQQQPNPMQGNHAYNYFSTSGQNPLAMDNNMAFGQQGYQQQMPPQRTSVLFQQAHNTMNGIQQPWNGQQQNQYAPLPNSFYNNFR